jgi:hypothetical protein
LGFFEYISRDRFHGDTLCFCVLFNIQHFFRLYILLPVIESIRIILPVTWDLWCLYSISKCLSCRYVLVLVLQ